MQAPVTLLCLPCAGASASMYVRWRRLLPAWITVMPVELPGRGSRIGDVPIEDYRKLVSLLSKERIGTLPARYALWGHSMGALLAYGMGVGLYKMGRPPEALLVSGCAAPSRRDAKRFMGRNDDATLIADLRKQGGTPEEVLVNAELMRIVLNVLRADYRVCGSFHYTASERAPFPVHVFAGRTDDIGSEQIEAWSSVAGKGITTDWFDGGHFFIRDSEAQVLDVITRHLACGIAGERHAAPVAG